MAAALTDDQWTVKQGLLPPTFFQDVSWSCMTHIRQFEVPGVQFYPMRLIPSFFMA